MRYVRRRLTIGIALILVGLLGVELSALALSFTYVSCSLTMDQATAITEDYLRRIGNKDLTIDKIMEFARETLGAWQQTYLFHYLADLRGDTTEMTSAGTGIEEWASWSSTLTIISEGRTRTTGVRSPLMRSSPP